MVQMTSLADVDRRGIEPMKVPMAQLTSAHAGAGCHGKPLSAAEGDVRDDSDVDERHHKARKDHDPRGEKRGCELADRPHRAELAPGALRGAVRAFGDHEQERHLRAHEGSRKPSIA